MADSLPAPSTPPLIPSSTLTVGWFPYFHPTANDINLLSFSVRLAALSVAMPWLGPPPRGRRRPDNAPTPTVPDTGPRAPDPTGVMQRAFPWNLEPDNLHPDTCRQKQKEFGRMMEKWNSRLRAEVELQAATSGLWMGASRPGVTLTSGGDILIFFCPGGHAPWVGEENGVEHRCDRWDSDVKRAQELAMSIWRTLSAEGLAMFRAYPVPLPEDWPYKLGVEV
ncbi:uncharacterized protein B0T15DRAFT_529685 [Chaetomium strumarium]|uniref:Uncharacterized protein n=1 Tax=Chaetomium strumarium TaxID=1170767 RepID=A0AAJ0GW68_9PEZI|nr:hypothetical protein B0T15DRAFT_529685 [Chaetomium strumarium]